MLIRFDYNLIVGEINNYSQFFHVYNKTIDGKRIFALDKHVDAQVFLETLAYYRSSNVSLRFSKYRNIDTKKYADFIEQYIRDINDESSFNIKILGYCFMPTHYHLLVYDNNDSLKSYISTSINSFTRYFNIKYERMGQLFISPFKSKPIRDESTLLHVSRYIHLNPYTAGISTTFNLLIKYPFSSYSSYLGYTSGGYVNKEIILEYFNNRKIRYKEFIQDQADYQKTLEQLKKFHLAGG